MTVNSQPLTSNMTDITDIDCSPTDRDCDKNLSLDIINFNCNGFKGSYGGILNLIKDNDCVFLCETWLKPNELNGVSKQLNSHGFWCNMKSSIDPEELLVGRPYGGVGFICKRINGVTYVPLPCDNDRIMAVQVVIDSKVLLTMIGVYMPYHDGSANQATLYSETLEDIQCIIDTNDPSPVMLLGDMNASLPRTSKLSRHWHRSHPFTKHSYLLYEFICQNDMYCCNFKLDNGAKFTYYKNGVDSYIDHVFLSRFAQDRVSECSVSSMYDIVSDHLPVRTNITVQVSHAPSASNHIHSEYAKFPRIDWSDSNQCKSFASIIEGTARALPCADINSIRDHQTAKTEVDKMCEALQTVIHEAAQQVLDNRQTSYCGRHKKKHWWNSDCLYNRDRQRFWFGLWKAAGRPRDGHVFACYKMAKKSYRDACRLAVNTGIGMTYKQLDYLKGHRNINKFWNLVRQSKCTSGPTDSDISLHSLHDYYQTKFDYDHSYDTNTVCEAELKVQQHYEEVRCEVNYDFIMTEEMLRLYIGRLRNGCAAGIDGISAEHLKWSLDTRILSVLSGMLTLCIRFGIVGDSFMKGLLVPILKKPSIDPSLSKNYRPVVISTTFSKVLEIHILSMCGEHEFHDLQFGFVSSRGTSMAVSLTCDVIDYCVSKGSPVYVCALDAEGAFDGIPHSIMFSKALDVIPTIYWRLLIYWYSHLVVYIKWCNKISQPINIKKGTRQGGLSSPFIFNLLYQDLVHELSAMPCGILLGETSYNLCCYADDLLLCSLTIKGLQELINAADRYITQHGLRFNPVKTSCVTFGKSKFPNRKWHLQGTQLTETSEIKHLGVILANDNRRHCESRIQSARRAFYSLQGAGLCVNGGNPSTISYIYNTAIRPVLTYGLECIYQCDTVVKKAEVLQSKLLKTALGIKYYCKTSPLLKALNIDRVTVYMDIQKLSLFKSMFLSTSRTNKLCKYLLKETLQGRLASHKNLISSVMQICDKYNVSLARILCERSYYVRIKHLIKSTPMCGIADSVKYCLSKNDVDTVNKLLSPF